MEIKYSFRLVFIVLIGCLLISECIIVSWKYWTFPTVLNMYISKPNEIELPSVTFCTPPDVRYKKSAFDMLEVNLSQKSMSDVFDATIPINSFISFCSLDIKSQLFRSYQTNREQECSNVSRVFESFIHQTGKCHSYFNQFEIRQKVPGQFLIPWTTDSFATWYLQFDKSGSLSSATTGQWPSVSIHSPKLIPNNIFSSAKLMSGKW